MALGVLLSYTSCGNKEDIIVVDDFIENDYQEPAEINETGEYKKICFKDLPKSITDNYDGEEEWIEIDGFLADTVSHDGTVGYLWNNIYDTTPSNNSIGSAIVLDLNDVDVDSLATIDDTDKRYVKVKGKIKNSQRIDVYNIKSEWGVYVETISVLDDVPDNVETYDSFVDSQEFEALSKTIDFSNEVLSEWSNDTELVEVSVEDVGCDVKELTQKTESLYPEIYDAMKTEFNDLLSIYDSVSNSVKEKKRLDNVDEVIDRMLDDYNSMADAVIYYGFFE